MKTHQTHTPPIDEAHDYTDSLSGDSREEQMRSINPADRTVVGEVQPTRPDDVDDIVERARETQRAFSRKPLATRIDHARSIFDELLEWRRELLELVVDETGKSPLEARCELMETWREVRNMLSEADERLSDASRSHWWAPGRRIETSWVPRGTVLVVASGSDPFHTTVAPVLAAIIAGNAVVVAADEDAPLMVHSVANIAAATGIPERLFTAVAGGAELVDSLADRVEAIVSYGAAGLTRRLARRQAQRMIPVMGRWDSRDVMVVLADADLKAAARAAVRGSCCQAGRSMRALRRIYVQQCAVEPFVDAVVEEVGTLRQADRENGDGIEVGPLADRHQLEKMEEMIDDACRRGARLVAGGRIRPRCRGNYFEPTVLTGVDESMKLWQQSTPGPVVAITGVEAPAEAVRRTRDVDGYSSVAVFTDNRDVARTMAENLAAPLVGINEVVRHVPVGAPAVRAAEEGPLDPVGAGRLCALSRRVLKVENRWSLPSILDTSAPRKMERALNAALAVIHRRGWLRKTVDSVWP